MDRVGADLLLLGIDAGTTSMKAALFDVAGRTIASASEEYRLLTPRADIVELAPETYWCALGSCVGRVLTSPGVRSASIRALAISSQGETFIPVDGHGVPLRNAIVWLDNRSEVQAERIRAAVGTERAYHVSGSPEVVPTWAATKILWIRENEPDVFEKAARYLLVEDYLVYRLTGEFVGESALYCSTLLMDINTGRWWDEMLELIGLRREQLPRLTTPGETVGPVSSEVAEATGLSTETLVITGGMDQACGSVGSGNIARGVITETTGASLNICATTDSPVFDPKMRIPCQVHGVPDKYILLPWCQTAGMTLKWFRDEFCAIEKQEANDRGVDAYDLLGERAAEAPAGAGGLVMLPHLAGAMCPELNPKARGVFFGIGLHTTKSHFLRAVMESVAFMLRRNIEVIEELGIEADRLISLGGAARSDLWNQTKADVMDRPVAVLNNSESACLGAAILAGWATGVYDSIAEACERMVSVRRTYEPDAGNREVYDASYGKYCEVYRSLEPVF